MTPHETLASPPHLDNIHYHKSICLSVYMVTETDTWMGESRVVTFTSLSHTDNIHYHKSICLSVCLYSDRYGHEQVESVVTSHKHLLIDPAVLALPV